MADVLSGRSTGPVAVDWVAVAGVWHAADEGDGARTGHGTTSSARARTAARAER